MSNFALTVFAVSMVAVATILYLLGFRWYDHDATGVGAMVVIVIMAAVLIKTKQGRRK